ncbi:hypothetical protein VI817_009017 [Penicillium citrinum]|nr:hypothetical protein VI817_009017 [Penicillium citrinum]
MSSTEGNTGHVGAMCHKQPVMEKYLRSVLQESMFSDLRTSCTLTAIQEDEEWVYAKYVDPTGSEKHICSKFLVAADGKTGFTRKKYLEPKGIELEWTGQTRYSETWVALNWKLHLPTKESHPSFPLWDLGYSSEEVYDLFFPADFRFLCNAKRPAVCGRFGLPEDRLWRFEFVIAAGEDGTEMSQRDKVRQVVGPYITHPGSRYGLSEDVMFPEDCIEVLRSRPFGFSARSCNKWNLGRTILCGDAAHVFPPCTYFLFVTKMVHLKYSVPAVLTSHYSVGGQGIASGFRDAIGLAWRLAILCSSTTKLDHESILTAWYQERKQQLDKSLAATVKNGRMVNNPSVIHGYLRNWILWGIKLVPRWQHALERGPRADGPTRYNYQSGFPFLPELQGGLCFPQTYCTAADRHHESGSRPVHFTDDVIFAPEKKCLFQVVVLLRDMNDLRSAVEHLSSGSLAANRYLCVDEATYFVPRTSLQASEPDADSDLVHGRLFRSATAKEFMQSPLCSNRPEPRGYNENLLWDSLGGKKYVVLRADRFVLAACDGGDELEYVASRINTMFS